MVVWERGREIESEIERERGRNIHTDRHRRVRTKLTIPINYAGTC